MNSIFGCNRSFSITPTFNISLNEKDGVKSNTLLIISMNHHDAINSSGIQTSPLIHNDASLINDPIRKCQKSKCFAMGMCIEDQLNSVTID